MSNNREEGVNKTSYEDPTDEMIKRWIKIIRRRVPTVDLVDISAEVFPVNSKKRQFAPEYSYTTYSTFLSKEEAIGDYTLDPNCSGLVTAYARQQMVLLIEELHLVK